MDAESFLCHPSPQTHVPSSLSHLPLQQLGLQVRLQFTPYLSGGQSVKPYIIRLNVQTMSWLWNKEARGLQHLLFKNQFFLFKIHNKLIRSLKHKMLLLVSYSFINIFLCKSLSYCTCMNIHFVFIERLNIVALLCSIISC